MQDHIFPATYLTKSNEKGFLIKIIPENFEKLKNKALCIRDKSNDLGDYNIASNTRPHLSIYGFYSEYVVGKLLGIYDDFNIFLDNLDVTKGLDGGKDIILNNGKIIQVKFTEWKFNNRHTGDIMNQFDRKLTSDYYILVTKGDEFEANSLRIVGWTDKTHFSLQDDTQTSNGFIKKKQLKINRCIVQTNLFDMKNLELNLGLKFNLTGFTIIN